MRWIFQANIGRRCHLHLKEYTDTAEKEEEE